ncbi:hypothetical protein SIPHO063v1_p0060 [Vibrio phage PS10B.1]|nr:hypothetical protein SIPHO063v1_p0060 [Vibrio phage PS10B.1]
MRKFNINLEVKVKLTEYGVAELKRQHDELNEQLGGKLMTFKEPSTDDEGFSTFQLHDLMHRFGHLHHIGNNQLPFEGNDIYFSEHN